MVPSSTCSVLVPMHHVLPRIPYLLVRLAVVSGFRVSYLSQAVVDTVLCSVVPAGLIMYYPFETLPLARAVVLFYGNKNSLQNITLCVSFYLSNGWRTGRSARRWHRERERQQCCSYCNREPSHLGEFANPFAVNPKNI